MSQINTYRLLAGSHSCSPTCGPHRAGDIIESPQDLVAIFGKEKFELVLNGPLPKDSPEAEPQKPTPVPEVEAQPEEVEPTKEDVPAKEDKPAPKATPRPRKAKGQDNG